MKAAVICIIGSLVSAGHAGAKPLIEGWVRLPSGAPAAGAQVGLFDLGDLRAAPIGATTDQSGNFTLSVGALPGTALQERFELGSNYPNPFNPSTFIPYQLPSSMHVRLEVFNLLGQRIATLVDGEQPAGFHTAEWDATDAAGQAVWAGVYLYRLSGDAGMITGRMLLVHGQAGSASAGWAASARDEAGPAGETALAYGLTVSGPGVVPYVDPAFQVTAGMSPLDVVAETPSSAPRAKVASDRILGDVDNTGRVDFLDALLVALYSRDSSIVMPNSGDISLGDVNADGRVDLSDVWVIAAYLNDPTDPTLPAGIAQSVGPAASLSPDPATVTFADNGAWHRFSVEAREPVSVVVNPAETTPRLQITTRGHQGNSCPAEADADASREDGQTIYLSGCAAGQATVELRREADGTVLRRYTFEVTGSPADLVVQSVSVSDSSLRPRQSFTLRATVRNQGTGQSAATTLRYYRSTDRTISTQDTQVGTGPVSALAASRTSPDSIRLTAPSSEGTYYYGACVAGVSGESDTRNNCSPEVNVMVEDTSVDLFSIPTNGGVTFVVGPQDTTGKATLTAHPNYGYDFEKWTEDGVTLSTDRVYVMDVTGTHEVSAHFSVNQDRSGIWNGGQTYTDYYFPEGPYESLAWTFVSVADPPESLAEEGLLHYYAYNFSLENHTANQGGGYAGFQSNGLIHGQQQGKVINFSIWGSNGARTDGLLESANTECNCYQIMYPFEWVEGRAYRFVLGQGPGGVDSRGKWWGLWVTDQQTGETTFIGESRLPTSLSGRRSTMLSAKTYLFGEDLHWWRSSRIGYVCSDFQPSSLAVLDVTAGQGVRPRKVRSFVNSGQIEKAGGRKRTNCHVTLFENDQGDVQHNLGFWPEPPPNILD